jgi:hypothetical protein
MKRSLVRILIGVAVLVGIFLLLDRGVTQIWYDARQRALGSDFAVGRSHIAVGQALALLQIPRIGLNVTVVQGDTASVLRGGPGHRVGTPPPGARGNSVIFGHRHGWGGPFADLDQLRKNDLVVTKIRKLHGSGGIHANADDGSVIANPTLAIAILAFLLAWLAFTIARRRYRTLAVVAVVAPLFLAGFLALFVAADRVLPPLR